MILGRWLVLCLMMVTPVPLPASPQISSAGAVAGQVTDPQTKAVPGAEVRLTDVATRATRTTVTNDAGRYIFLDLPPGSYTATVSKEGFAQAQLPPQQVEVGMALTLDATLAVGSLQTVIDVKAGAGSELQTMNATLGASISFQSLLDL